MEPSSKPLAFKVKTLVLKKASTSIADGYGLPIKFQLVSAVSISFLTTGTVITPLLNGPKKV